MVDFFHFAVQVCLVTLRLFDTLLQKEEEHIFHNLVLRNLLGRDYFQPPASSDKQKILLKSDSNPASQNETETDRKSLCPEPKNSSEGSEPGSPSSPSPDDNSPLSPTASIGSIGELAGEWVSS